MAELSQQSIPQVTIPVFVDSVKRELGLARMTYFSIEAEQPSPDWMLSLGGQSIPLYLISMSGIIHRPTPEQSTFQSAAQIDKLFDSIEQDQTLMVDINHIWLPDFVLSEPYTRSDVYRIGAELFTEALNFVNSQIGKSAFLEVCKAHLETVSRSDRETLAFKEWGDLQVKNAKDQFPKDRSLELKWS